MRLSLNKIWKLLPVLWALWSAGCASGLYQPEAVDLQPGVELATLKEGRRLYVASCGRCHDLHWPDEFDTDGWVERLDLMQPKAKITDREKNLILSYLTNAPKGK